MRTPSRQSCGSVVFVSPQIIGIGRQRQIGACFFVRGQAQTEVDSGNLYEEETLVVDFNGDRCQMPPSSLPPDFTALQEVADEIRSARKGLDFLVLEDNDEMKGYASTALEEKYLNTVKAISIYIETQSSSPVSNLRELVVSVLSSLVKVQPAVHAYRSRMYRYATDWGSEVSIIGNWSRVLYDCIEPIVDWMTIDERVAIYDMLPEEVRNASIRYIFWTNYDRHNEKRLSIRSILLG